jgi:protocatechuate 3,4-dioxygenase beta subunit
MVPGRASISRRWRGRMGFRHDQGQCGLLVFILRLVFVMVAISGVPDLGQTPAERYSSTANAHLAAVSGTISDASGQPLRGAIVTLQSAHVADSPGPGRMPALGAVTSDVVGRFSFSNISPGQYFLKAEHTGYLSGGYGSTRSSRTGVPLTLAAGEQLSDITIEMFVAGNVEGRVLEWDGTPIPRSTVRLLRSVHSYSVYRYLSAGSVVTDSNGDFKFSAVSPGRYFLCASPLKQEQPTASKRQPQGSQESTDEGDVTTYYAGNIDIAAATPIDVSLGQDVSGISVRLVKEPLYYLKGKVSGVVTPNDRMNVVASLGANIVLPFVDKSVPVATDGSFDLSGLSSGWWRLEVVTERRLAILGTILANIDHQNLEQVAIPIQPLSDLGGVVRVEGERAQQLASDRNKSGADEQKASFRLTLNPVDGRSTEVLEAKTGTDGSFNLSQAQPGRYRLSVDGGVDAVYLKSVIEDSVEMIDSGFDITGGGSRQLDVTVSLNGGRIDGSVRNADRERMPGARVTLIPRNAPERIDLYRVVNADQYGRFSLRGIAPGEYQLQAWEDLELGSEFDPEFTNLHSSHVQSVTVAENTYQEFSLEEITMAEADADARAAR